MKTVICYKTINPVVYNENTPWERTESIFLFCYARGMNLENAKQTCEELNHTRPTQWKGMRIDWNKIDYLFADEQEEMCG